MHISRPVRFYAIATAVLSVLALAWNIPPVKADPIPTIIGQGDFTNLHKSLVTCGYEKQPRDVRLVTNWVGQADTYAWFTIVGGDAPVVLTSTSVTVNVGTQSIEGAFFELPATSPDKPIDVSMESWPIGHDATIQMWVDPVGSSTATQVADWAASENDTPCY